MVGVVYCQSIGGLMAQADRLVPKVGGHQALCCTHHVNRVNSRNALSMTTAPCSLSWYYYYYCYYNSVN